MRGLVITVGAIVLLVGGGFVALLALAGTAEAPTETVRIEINHDFPS